MKKFLVFLSSVLFALGLLFVISTQASAVIIFDTGQPTGPTSKGIYWYTSPSWMAGQFTITEDFTVTDIEGWIEPDDPGDLTIAIYGDGGDTPDKDNELYSQVLSFSIVEGPEDWYGLSGLSWDLVAGTYWVSFEPRVSSTFAGSMRDGPPNPLDRYTIGYFSPTTTWTFGMRAEGISSSAPVPEPATMLLLGSGLAGLVAFRRRFRKS